MPPDVPGRRPLARASRAITVVHVRQLPDPPLWCWELLEPQTNHLVEGSWQHHWLAFSSREAALEAGHHAQARAAADARDDAVVRRAATA
jgi:hypothetical protein